MCGWRSVPVAHNSCVECCGGGHYRHSRFHLCKGVASPWTSSSLSKVGIGHYFVVGYQDASCWDAVQHDCFYYNRSGVKDGL